ncbi:Hypothetical protein NTJ_10355 [Nesidiocoris tenuis]|uniref:Uncharacterized protein n=1 Tax=Nesidiocoris tenuis TaxID=355587 RepID=A0ABN7AZE0_9HEMI|nr:Hypothetical protein NTJ_10355 [Nesidiocoris tenuis]
MLGLQQLHCLPVQTAFEPTEQLRRYRELLALNQIGSPRLFPVLFVRPDAFPTNGTDISRQVTVRGFPRTTPTVKRRAGGSTRFSPKSPSELDRLTVKGRTSFGRGSQERFNPDRSLRDGL